MPIQVTESIVDLFHRCARLWPKQPAVMVGSATLSYEELDRASDRIAHLLLKTCGHEPVPVLALFDNGPTFFISLMGIFKAGKIYVPVEPSEPTARLSFLVLNSRAKILLTDTVHLPSVLKLQDNELKKVNIDEIPPGLQVDAPLIRRALDDVACILYTSGSTGEPKGVVQTHRNILHADMRYVKATGMRQRDRVLRPTSLAFGGGFRSVLSALTTGATIVTLQKERLDSLPMVLKRDRISICHMPPAVLRHLLDNLQDGEEFPYLRLFYVGGDGLTRSDIRLFRERLPSGCILVHALALTEAGAIRHYFGAESAFFEGDIVPVGYEVEDMEILILDENQNPLPVGETGEIAVRSRFLSPGYWGRPDLTQKAYLPDGTREDVHIYLTGDLGRMLSDGCLIFLGRKAFQLKIRGYSVGIIEVKSALLSVPGVREAFVTALSDSDEESRIIAYVVPMSKGAMTVSLLRHLLSERLPDYMIPSVFVMMESLPVKANGKVDRNALPEPRIERSVPQVDAHAQNPVETVIADIWCSVLKLRSVGMDENFFELGGHSLAATRILSRIRNEFGVEIPIRGIFDAPTVSGLASKVVDAIRSAWQQED